MFNVTIINAKGSIKKIAILIVTLILLFIITKFIQNLKSTEIFKINLSSKLVKCLNNEIPAINEIVSKSNTTIKEENEEDTKDFSERILGVELSRLKESEKIEENPIETPSENIENKPVEEEKDNNNSNVDVSNISENVETQIVTQNPISESFNNEINGVKIKNETSFDIPDDIMNTELDIDKNNILIFHTHTCESYTPSEKYQYEQTGNFRTTDLNYTVARLGDELTNYLLGFGFKVNHDKTYHDYPAYTGSYSRSLESVKKDLQENPSDIIIDLHRDAIGSKSDYDPSVKIGDDVASQLMFVIGTNGGGLYHPNWQSNLKFAIELQQKANKGKSFPFRAGCDRGRGRGSEKQSLTYRFIRYLLPLNQSLRPLPRKNELRRRKQLEKFRRLAYLAVYRARKRMVRYGICLPPGL